MHCGLIRSSLLLLPVVVLSLSLGGCPPVNSDTGSQKNLVFDRIVIDSADSGGATAVMAADFDGDGKLDVISAWKDPGEVRLHLQQRVDNEISWKTVSLAWGAFARGAQALAVADISGDNRPDILVATNSSSILYLRQIGSDSGNPANWDVTSIDVSGGLNLDSWSDVQVADVDGDLQLEVIATLESPAAKICVFDPPARPANGTGWRKVDVVVTGLNGVTQVLPVDLNADGAVDLLTIARGENPDSVVWHASPGNSNALDKAWSHYPIGYVNDPRAVAWTDMDGDAFSDIVVTAGNGHSIVGFQRPADPKVLMDANKRWVQYSIVSLGTAVGSGIYSANMDIDPANEIISATSGAGKLSLYKWDATAAVWVEKVLDSTSASYGRPLVVDLDLSGAYDVLCAAGGAKNEIVWYRQH